jgi:hypothetical protein
VPGGPPPAGASPGPTYSRIIRSAQRDDKSLLHTLHAQPLGARVESATGRSVAVLQALGVNQLAEDVMPVPLTDQVGYALPREPEGEYTWVR